MKKRVVFISFLLITVLLGVTIPKLIYHDAKNVSPQTIKIAKDAAREVLEHPSDFFQIMNLVVREENQGKVYLNAYTFFGLKYAVVEVVFDTQTRQVNSINRVVPQKQ